MCSNVWYPFNLLLLHNQVSRKGELSASKTGHEKPSQIFIGFEGGKVVNKSSINWADRESW